MNPKFEDFTKRKSTIFIYNRGNIDVRKDRKKIIELIKQKVNKPIIRAIVIGVTNVGKSTLINTLAGSSKTKVENRPGVTRTKQWVNVQDNMWVLDTPGVLWPDLTNQRIAKNLAYIGSIKDDVLDFVELARCMFEDLKLGETLNEFCKRRGYLLKGGKLDLERGAKAILTEFREGKLGFFDLDDINPCKKE